MKAMIQMWRHTRMVVLSGVVAAIYASAQVVLAPLSFPVLPGAPFKIADLFTMLLGLLGGPAGALGVGIGNAIGDFFTGGLGLGSIFGFLSTVSVGFVGYTFWHRFRNPSTSRGRQLALYFFTGAVAAAVSAVILGWGLDLLGIAPFRLVSKILVVNFTLGNWIGFVLFSVLYERLHNMGLIWTDIMSAGEIGKGENASLGALMMTIGGFGGAIAGFVVSETAIVPVVSIFVVIIILGACFL
jgi:energy-coupling factor transport system substrate-specific component